MQRQECYEVALVSHKESKPCFERQESKENRISSPLSTDLTGRSVLDQEESPVDESSLCSTSTICPAPLCRQFWKAGNYEDALVSKPTLQKGTGYLRIHPKFLHSNATSHKWAFGAIAELLDNAVDEVQKGATFVVVDKTSNPRDGSSALLIQDDGGGMDPDAMRRCLSFGFSDKKSKSAIGRYGNGFKTSSMRLGADVIVFSRCTKNRKCTQSIGLLSYTFLMQTGYDRIVVPMVDYEFTLENNAWRMLNSLQHHMNNLSLLLRWSPYSTEEELLKQFEDVGQHGTKIVIYNLWCKDDGKLELDFESDIEDIRICEDANKNERGSKLSASQQHLANQFRFSLRAYLSILYLRIPENFCMFLRGQVVVYHNIADDLKYPEFILYRPQSGGSREGQVVTTIGFIKEAPTVNIHGFNVYHKNRLILPFWHVVSYSDSRGRGVVGVLEANFIEPTHNKQDFEKTPVFQKLEQRLKEMTWEYWDYHCGLIGYQTKKIPRAMTSHADSQPHRFFQPVLLTGDSFASKNAELLSSGGAILPPTAHSSASAGNQKTASHCDSQKGTPLRRRAPEHLLEPEKIKRKLGTQANTVGSTQEILPGADSISNAVNQEAANLIEENKKLRTRCLEYEKRREELNLKVAHLRVELGEVQRQYSRLLAESKSLESVKEENQCNNVVDFFFL